MYGMEVGLCFIGLLLSDVNVTAKPYYRAGGDLEETQGVQNETFTVLQTLADISPSQVTNFRCTIRNNSGKELDAYVVIWRTTYSSGVTHTNNVALDDFLFASRKILAGETFEVRSSIKLGSTPNNPVVKVEAVLDYVQFTDGTNWGPNSANKAQLIKARREGANSYRRLLQKTYQDKGVDVLIKELRKQ